MPDDASRELTLYVQSKKVITNFYRPPATRIAGDAPQGISDYRGTGSTGDSGPGSADEAFFLSDDQAHALATVEEFAKSRGYALKVVDVAKAGRLERLVTEHLRGVSNFPVLVGLGGARLEGLDAFTEEAICAIMPAEMSSLRAFTYLKIRGGDLDRIRSHLLGFGEVKEIHLLTGDWDVFVVLEFPGDGRSKRKVLDFITERIRGIPEVLDTSTLVPEHSVTKFP